MPELWEHCNAKSKAILVQLYWEEYGCYPDWYLGLSGKQMVTVSPDIEEDQLEETQKFMQRPPTRRFDD